jgi:negative regulator of sigma-B (phosphoserine phosphatase)
VKLTIACQSQPASGELVNGDTIVVREHDGAHLIAIVDVLGHGHDAAQVAKLAARSLETAPMTRAAVALLGLHDALRGTRGAAAAICILRGDRLDGCGVGNVEVRVLGTPMAILLTPGIVGQRMHRLREFEGRLAPGDRVVWFSDGISSHVPLGELRNLAPGEACTMIMQRHRRRHDDASVVVADVVAEGT